MKVFRAIIAFLQITLVQALIIPGQHVMTVDSAAIPPIPFPPYPYPEPGVLDYLTRLTTNLELSSTLEQLVSHNIRLEEIRESVLWLTGEAGSEIKTRLSSSDDARKAAQWIAREWERESPSPAKSAKDEMEQTGAQCERHTYNSTYAPNVICRYPGTHDESDMVVLSAHYDSKGSEDRAPGADDDASGVSLLMGVGKAIHRSGLGFEKNIVLAFFSGEEQGLKGSMAYTDRLKHDNITLLLDIQCDNLAYRIPGNPMQIAFPNNDIHTPEASDLLANISQLYAPELTIGRTSMWGSDHQSFLRYGYPATWIFENAGGISDPMYHTPNDISQRPEFDYGQLFGMAKVALAALMIVAGYNTGE